MILKRLGDVHASGRDWRAVRADDPPFRGLKREIKLAEHTLTISGEQAFEGSECVCGDSYYFENSRLHAIALHAQFRQARDVTRFITEVIRRVVPAGASAVIDYEPAAIPSPSATYQWDVTFPVYGAVTVNVVSENHQTAWSVYMWIKQVAHD